MSKKISAIVATDLNNAIGKDNKLLWHLPADLKFFKETTMGCPVIMGRKTYESIGRLLPGRKNIIISRNKELKIEGAEIYSDIKEAIEKCDAEKIFILGGAEIYDLALPFTEEIYRTLVKSYFDADTFFPDIDLNKFKLIWQKDCEKDEKNKLDYRFEKYERIV